ncbi:uncharacterized protein LOC135344319 [Halichondria panicea]|uniref:uncharacterized protein LOC135344319 n=1 Tax=Halichondria panicea TaxID=6063 RepID=UPI00312B405A
MGVDVPLDAVTSLLREQQEWDSDRIRRSSKEHIHKRNLQKKARKTHHEQEKSYMETLRGLGSAVGEYIGDGQGESSTVEPPLTSADIDIVDAESGVDDQSQNDEEASLCFIDWLATTTAHVSEVTGIPHYPVLVAHNGFSFDFPVLLAEVERRPESLATSIFEAKNIHFSDTLPLLRQMKKNGDSHLAGKKLGMGDLYLHTLGTCLEGAHRAFPDVLAMEAVMTHQSLISCPPNLPVRSAKKQMELWTSQKQRFHQADALIRSLGKPSITAAQAKRLIQLGLEHSALVTLRPKSSTPEAFMEALKGKGVKSKALCIKLAKLVHSLP